MRQKFALFILVCCLCAINQTYARSHHGKVLLQSFHMGPEDHPVDENYSNNDCCSDCCDICGDEECYFVDDACDCCSQRCWNCCGAPLYDDRDKDDQYDQTMSWPGKTESTWMRELKR